MRYVVSMESPVYGYDEFVYDSEREALEGFKRLRDSAERYTVKDGIGREVCYHGPKQEED